MRKNNDYHRFIRNIKKSGEKHENISIMTGLQDKTAALVTDTLGLPGEVLFNIPKLVLTGNRTLLIENYKGIMEYDPLRIRISTGSGVIRISGKNLTIKHITSEDILIEGLISSIDFL